MSTDYNKMTVAQLKESLLKKGLNQIGKKQDLVDRLLDSDKPKEESVEMSEEQIISEIDELATNGSHAENAEEDEKMETANEQENGADEEDVKKEEEEKEKEAIEDTEAAAATEATETEETTEAKDKTTDETEVVMADEEKKEEKTEPKEEEEKLPVGKGTIVALDDDTKIVIPSSDTIKQDFDMQNKLKTVALYPVKVEDLSDAAFTTFFTSCLHFNVSFMENEHQLTKTDSGYIEMRFATNEEAEESAKELSEQRPDMTVKHLTAKDTKEDIVKKDESAETAGSLTSRHLYIGNLPSSATEQNLQTIFPDAVHLSIAFNEESIPKGYAIAEMESKEAVERATIMYRNIEFEEKKLIVLTTWQRPPKGLLDYRARQDVLKRVRNIKYRVTNRRARVNNPLAIQKMENEMRKSKEQLFMEMRLCKQQLDKDCKVREEIGLPSPPDVIHREKVLAEKKLKKEEEDKEKKEKGEDTEEKEGDGDKKEKKSSPAKIPVSKVPPRKDTSNRTRGSSGRFQSPHTSYSGRGGMRGRDNRTAHSSYGAQSMGGRQGFTSPGGARGNFGATGSDSYQPRGQNMQQAMSLLKNIQDMMLTGGGNMSGGASSFGGAASTGFDNYSGGYSDNFSSANYSASDNYSSGYGGSGYSQGNKRRLSNETYGQGAGNKRGPGQGGYRQGRQGYGGGSGQRW